MLLTSKVLHPIKPINNILVQIQLLPTVVEADKLGRCQYGYVA